jgi:hypothetical protein
MAVLNWHEGQIVAWKSSWKSLPMKMTSERYPSCQIRIIPLDVREKSSTNVFWRTFVRLDTVTSRWLFYHRRLGLHLNIPFTQRNDRIVSCRFRRGSVSTLRFGERRHLVDLVRQTAKYGQSDLTDECYLWKQEQKEGEIVLFIKQ